MGWNRKEGEGNKNFKKGRGKLDALKKEVGTPFQSMVNNWFYYLSTIEKKQCSQLLVCVR